MDTSPKQQKVYIERDRTGLFGLHISNLAPEITENDLRGLFSSSGFIEVCKILRQQNTHIAFVKFTRYEEALVGLQKVNGTKFGGRILNVRPAYETNRKPHRFGKEGSTSSESLSKQNRGASNAAVNGNISEENDEKTDSKDAGKDAGKKVDSLPTKENPAIKTEDEANAYMLPPASQDIRYNHGNTSACSTSSLESLSDKAPLKSSPFTPKENTHRQMGIAANFDRLKKNDNSHSPGSGQVKVKTENISAPTKVNSINSPATFPVTQNVGKMQIGGKCQNRQGKAYISKWSVEEVAEFFQRQVECTESMVTFIKEQEIDGNALMLIEECSLLHFMKLGPALKFLNLREKLKN